MEAIWKPSKEEALTWLSCYKMVDWMNGWVNGRLGFNDCFKKSATAKVKNKTSIVANITRSHWPCVLLIQSVQLIKSVKGAAFHLQVFGAFRTICASHQFSTENTPDTTQKASLSVPMGTEMLYNYSHPKTYEIFSNWHAHGDYRLSYSTMNTKVKSLWDHCSLE